MTYKAHFIKVKSIVSSILSCISNHTLTEKNTVFLPEFSGFFLSVGFLKISFRNFRYHTGSLTSIATLIR